MRPDSAGLCSENKKDKPSPQIYEGSREPTKGRLNIFGQVSKSQRKYLGIC